DRSGGDRYPARRAPVYPRQGAASAGRCHRSPGCACAGPRSAGRSRDPKGERLMAEGGFRRRINAIAARQDLVLVILLVLIVFMIIVPLPTWLIDLSIGFNLAISVLIMIVAVYLK